MYIPSGKCKENNTKNCFFANLSSSKRRYELKTKQWFAQF